MHVVRPFRRCEDHSLTVGWVATMTDPLAVVLINVAVLAHLEYRERGTWLQLVAEVAALALALGCKESAVVAPVAIVLLELVLSGRHLRARLGLPCIAVLAAYMALQASLGLGGMRSLMYVNPVAQPMAYTLHAVKTLPVMIAAIFTVIPPSAAVFTPQFLLALAFLGVALGLLSVAALWPLRDDAALRWAALLTIVALLPQVATDASERLLYYLFVGARYVMAAVIARIKPLARLREEPLAPRFTRIWGWYLLAGVVLPGLVMASVMPLVFVRSLGRLDGDVATAVPVVSAHLKAHPHGTVVVLNLPGPMPTFYVGGIFEHHIGRPVPTRVLSGLNGMMSIERVDERTLILRTDRTGWLDNMFARIVRATPGFAVGQQYSNADFTATLERLTADTQDVLDVRFDFSRSLADPELLFLTWNGHHLVPINVALLAAGTRVPLADTSDVWKSM